MAVVAEFTVPSSAFAFGPVFESLEDVRVELERFVPLEEGVVPYLWVRGVTPAELEAAFAEHLPEHRMEVLDSVGGEHLLRITWLTEPTGMVRALVDSDVSLLRGRGTSTEWHLEVRSRDHEGLAAFERACHDADISPRLTVLHHAVTLEPPGRGGLTEKQHEAMALAYRMGYFDSPRQAGLEEIAAKLGISRQAVASRLRRALRHVVGQSLGA